MSGPSERYIPQAIAALRRHDETGGNWATEGSVFLACLAVAGDEGAQKSLDEDAAWQLDPNGELPVSVAVPADGSLSEPISGDGSGVALPSIDQT